MIRAWFPLASDWIIPLRYFTPLPYSKPGLVLLPRMHEPRSDFNRQYGLFSVMARWQCGDCNSGGLGQSLGSKMLGRIRARFDSNFLRLDPTVHLAKETDCRASEQG